MPNSTKRRWTEQEDTIIRDGCYASITEAVSSLAAHGYTRSYAAVTQRRKALGVSSVKLDGGWTPPEIRALKHAHLQGWSISKTVRFFTRIGFDRSYGQIVEKRFSMGLGKDSVHRRQYTTDEVNLLHEAHERELSIPDTQIFLRKHGFKRSKHSIYVKRSKLGFASREFQAKNHKRWWDNRSPEEVSKHRRRTQRTYRRLQAQGRKGIPNDTEWIIIQMGIEGLLPTLSNHRYHVRLKRRNGRVWYKNPDFAFGWQGPPSSGKPALVVEVVGSRWHSNTEVRHMINEYTRIGIQCIAISGKKLRGNPAFYERKIRRAILHIQEEQ